jgi:hypothetical protein
MVFSHDAASLASASRDWTVRIWNWREVLEPPSTFEPNPRLSVYLSADASLAVVLTNRSPAGFWFFRPGIAQFSLVDVEARVVETLSGKTRAILPGLTRPANFSPDGGRVVGLSTNDSRAHVWDTTTGRMLLTFDAPQTNKFAPPIFSPNGRQIAMAEIAPNGTGPPDHTVKLWDAFTGKMQLTLGKSQSVLETLAFSADGRWLLTGSTLNPLCTLWDTDTGREGSIVGDATISGVMGAAFSPDGSRLVTVNVYDAAIRVQWLRAKQTGETGGAFTLNTATARNVAFSPDGRRILSESDGTAKLWDAATGRDLLTLRTPGITKCQFSLDGHAIISARADGTLIRYEAATPAEVAMWEAAERPATVRRITDAARSSTSVLFGSRRYLELEAIAQDTLKTLRSDPKLDTASVVEFTLRLAASLLCRANTGNPNRATTPVKELAADAEGLLHSITGEQLAGYLGSDPGWDLAALLGQGGHWSQAEAFLARVTDAAPTNRIAWQLRAMVLAELGDASGYDKIRARLLPGVSTAITGSEVFAEIRTLTLRPLTATETALESVAARAIASEAEPVTLYSLDTMKGLIRYREGDFIGASESLDKAQADSASSMHPSFTATMSAVRAMVLFRLGRADQAHAALAAGTAILKANWFSPERETLEQGWWMDWLAVDLLLREARELIEGK